MVESEELESEDDNDMGGIEGAENEVECVDLKEDIVLDDQIVG